MILFDVAVWDDAFGHADLFNGKHSLQQDYWPKSKDVMLWEC